MLQPAKKINVAYTYPERLKSDTAVDGMVFGWEDVNDAGANDVVYMFVDTHKHRDGPPVQVLDD